MRKIVIMAIGLVFILIGTWWSVTIYQRCRDHGVENKPVTFSQQLSNGLNVVNNVKKTVVTVRETVKIAERSHAEPHHIFIFWMIAILEVFCAALFVLTGIFVLMRSPFTYKAMMVTFGADIFFKSSVLVYMKLVAVPLARLIGKRNLLISYFTLERDFWSQSTKYFTGLIALEPGKWVFPVAYVIIFGVVLIFFYKCFSPASLKVKPPTVT